MNKQRLSNKERLQKDELLSFLFGTDTEDIKKLSKFFEGYTPQFIFNTTKNNETKEESKNKTSATTNDKQNTNKQENNEAQFQKGDEVLIVNTPEGINNIKGVIVDEVKTMGLFLVQYSKLNAMYVDKSNLQIIKRKQDVEEEINRLKEKINKFETNKNELITDIQCIINQISGLKQLREDKQQELKQITKQSEQYKQQLEELEGR